MSHKTLDRGLWLRGRIYQFRVRVPSDIRHVIGREHVNRSLRTDSRSLAVKLSRRVAADFDAMFDAKRLASGLRTDFKLHESESWRAADVESAEQQPKCRSDQSRAATLSEVYKSYLEDFTKLRSARTILAHETTRRVVQDVLGADIAIAAITREDCRRLLETLRWLPVNLAQKFGNIAVSDAANAARNNPAIRTINTTNLNAYMARFATMLNWAVAEEYISRNPARGLQVADTVRALDRRKPFELWQLKRIFNAPVYTGCKDEQHGYSVAGIHIAKGARFWVPLICLFSGMRLNEACQLDVSDVREIEEVLCFVITTSSLIGTCDKSLKTRSSERLIPVHPELLEIGFMTFVERIRREGADKLFNDIPTGAKGVRSVAFSRWFARFLSSIGASSNRTCFHSFRHGFRDAARNAKIERDITLQLGGWTGGGGHRQSADAYGAGYQPRMLFEAISLIEYNGLDLAHLKLPSKVR